MAMDIPLCRTNKEQKEYVISWSKDLEYVELKHRSSCNYSFFHAQFEKKTAIMRNFIDFC